MVLEICLAFLRQSLLLVWNIRRLRFRNWFRFRDSVYLYMAKNRVILMRSLKPTWTMMWRQCDLVKDKRETIFFGGTHQGRRGNDWSWCALSRPASDGAGPCQNQIRADQNKRAELTRMHKDYQRHMRLSWSKPNQL